MRESNPPGQLSPPATFPAWLALQCRTFQTWGSGDASLPDSIPVRPRERGGLLRCTCRDSNSGLTPCESVPSPFGLTCEGLVGAIVDRCNHFRSRSSTAQPVLTPGSNRWWTSVEQSRCQGLTDCIVVVGRFELPTSCASCRCSSGQAGRPLRYSSGSGRNRTVVSGFSDQCYSNSATEPRGDPPPPYEGGESASSSNGARVPRPGLEPGREVSHRSHGTVRKNQIRTGISALNARRVAVTPSSSSRAVEPTVRFELTVSCLQGRRVS